MASIIDIANRALSKLGESRITSLDDDVKAAREIKAAIYIIRDSELRDHTWHFSKKRTSLAALSTTPEGTIWAYQYQKPTDLIRVLQVGETDPQPDVNDYRINGLRDWELEGSVILSNSQAPLFLRYVYRVEDTTLFDASFVEVLSTRVAFELCTAITQSQAIKETLAKEYQMAMYKAILNNSVELPPQSIPDDTWVIGRL